MRAVPQSHPLSTEWAAILARQPVAPSLSGFSRTSARAFTCGLNNRSVLISLQGALVVDKIQIGPLRYESEDVYNGTEFVCSAAFGPKKGSAVYGGATRTALGSLASLYVKSNAQNGCELLAEVALTNSGDGAPERSWLYYNVDSTRVKVHLTVLNKPPTRFNEAAWLGFQNLDSHSEWELTKLGMPMKFDEVVTGGSPHLHAAEFATLHRQTGRNVKITSLDAPVVAAVSQGSKPSVLMNNQMLPAEGVAELSWNLWNNMWSTNYL